MVLIDFLIFIFYRSIFLPLAVGILKAFSFAWPAKTREMIEDRAPRNFQALPSRPLWIHASSGEIEYAKSVVRAVKEQYPQIPILVTYFSPSAKRLIQKFPGIDLAMALPWDTKSEIDRFLDFYKPRACLIARTDVWPEMARQLRKRRIPSALFAATLAKNSSRAGLFASSLARIALNSLSMIFCVSAEDQENFKDLGVRTALQVGGDTRFDQVLHRLAHPSPIKNELRPSPETSAPIFVCGSTWPADEEILFEAFRAWFDKGGRLILAPHEVNEERIQSLKKTLLDRGWSVQTYRETSQWNSQILLVNQVGCLQELYTWGHLAFVGGSFKDKVHSVMEPLCAGLPVCVGPHHINNREALQFQHVILKPGFFAVNVIQNATDLQSLMVSSLSVPVPCKPLLSKIQSVSGATARVVQWLAEAQIVN
jgi:3-deoxy-D-manno-octulosonic-acid transferase